MKRAAHIFGDARGVVDLRGPFGQRREHLAEIHLLKSLAVEEAALRLADEQDHGSGVLPRDMHPGACVRGAGSARHHANAGLTRELSVSLGHHRSPALLAADDERHGLAGVVQRIDHRKVALAGHAKNELGAVQA